MRAFDVLDGSFKLKFILFLIYVSLISRRSAVVGVPSDISRYLGFRSCGSSAMTLCIARLLARRELFILFETLNVCRIAQPKNVRAQRRVSAIVRASSAVETQTLKIGTRGSPLALAQAYLTRDLLKVGYMVHTVMHRCMNTKYIVLLLSRLHSLIFRRKEHLKLLSSRQPGIRYSDSPWQILEERVFSPRKSMTLFSMDALILPSIP